MSEDRFTTQAGDLKVLKLSNWEKEEEVRVFQEAENGNPEPLKEYFSRGAAGQIYWPREDSFQECVQVARNYMENPEIFCRLRYRDAVGKDPEVPV